MEFGASARDLSQPLISKSYKTSDRLKSVRNTTISARSFTLSEQLEFVEKKKLQEVTYRDVKYSEIMEYYEPKTLAYGGFVASVFASLSLPLFGFVLSQYIFTLAMYGDPAFTITQVT